jgi:hypothetical protein
MECHLAVDHVNMFMKILPEYAAAEMTSHIKMSKHSKQAPALWGLVVFALVIFTAKNGDVLCYSV